MNMPGNSIDEILQKLTSLHTQFIEYGDAYSYRQQLRAELKSLQQ